MQHSYKWVKKWATGQSCIRKRCTTSKIGTLASNYMWKIGQNFMTFSEYLNLWVYVWRTLSFINFTSIAKVFATSNLMTSPRFGFFILIRIPRGTNRAASFNCAASTIEYDTLSSVTAVLELEVGKLIKCRFSPFMSGSSHIISVLICVKYQNCCRSLEVKIWLAWFYQSGAQILKFY